MKKSFDEVVQFLESLQIMPKTMPGLEKMRMALRQTPWYEKIDPAKVTVVAGTNGKGSTCAMLEALLLHAGQRVGFYSSPHLVSTNERIRLNGVAISKEDFVELFDSCEALIRSCQLSHFEALTLMAGTSYFSSGSVLDYVIFEVGLGGSFDATNAFPHRYSVITPIDFDHTSILGKTLLEIARNKWGIIQDDQVVVFQRTSPEIETEFLNFRQKISSRFHEVESAISTVNSESFEPVYELQSPWGGASLSLLGERAAQNAMTALTTFEKMGFSPKAHLTALSQVRWPGRMQKIHWPGLAAPVYLSGDHNPQGIFSLIEILKNFRWQRLYIVIGIGVDKDADQMLGGLRQLPRCRLCLTVTPFKGRNLSDYPAEYLTCAYLQEPDPVVSLQKLANDVGPDDLVVVTGSLYLVGAVLSVVR